MNDAGKEEQDLNVCANCGIAGVDDIKLEECNDCGFVKYCGDKCREEHREEHEEECKNRKAELNDRKLFTQPDETHLGECPLCFLPLPLDPQKSIFWSCCSKIVCMGCNYADRKSKSGGGHRCPFCREALPDNEEFERRLVKRIEASDPAALRKMGGKCYNEGDWDQALKYLTKAAELGNFHGHYMLGRMYDDGEGVEKDMEKAAYHWEKAAIGGHPYARHNLGYYEKEDGNIERAVKHYIIASKLGLKESMNVLWKHYSLGNITKDELETTLRSHQAALDAMKSPQREAAEAQQKRLQR